MTKPIERFWLRLLKLLGWLSRMSSHATTELRRCTETPVQYTFHFSAFTDTTMDKKWKLIQHVRCHKNISEHAEMPKAVLVYDVCSNTIPSHGGRCWCRLPPSTTSFVAASIR